MNVKTLYTFDGKSMTVAAIKRERPGFSEAVIREACEAGVTDLVGLHRFNNAKPRKPYKPSPASQITIVPADPSLHRAAPRER